MTAQPQALVLHVQADDPAPWALGGSPGLLHRRVMTRVADYIYAAPDGLDGVVMAEFAALEQAAKAAERSAGAGARSPQVNVFRQISPERGWLTARGVETAGRRPEGTTVLSVVMDVEHDALADFHGWYDEEHLPTLVAVPGILGAVRFAAVPEAEAPAASQPDADRSRFLAWYEMADPAVVASDEFAAASVLTPRTAAVTAHLSWASQLYVDAAAAR